MGLERSYWVAWKATKSGTPEVLRVSDQKTAVDVVDTLAADVPCIQAVDVVFDRAEQAFSSVRVVRCSSGRTDILG